MEQMTLSGTVVHGDGYGHKLGFPTANIDRRQWSRLSKKPRLGVYAGWIKIGTAKKFNAAAIVVGPADKKGLPKLEAHLLDFSGHLYGTFLQFQLVTFLRVFRQYSTEAQLMEAIRQDIKQVRDVLL